MEKLDYFVRLLTIFSLFLVLSIGFASAANTNGIENNKACEHASKTGKEQSSENSVLKHCMSQKCVAFAEEILSLRESFPKTDHCNIPNSLVYTVCAETETYGWACVYDESRIQGANNPEHGLVIGFSAHRGSIDRYDGALGDVVERYYIIGNPDLRVWSRIEFAVFCWDNSLEIC